MLAELSSISNFLAHKSEILFTGISIKLAFYYYDSLLNYLFKGDTE